MLLSHSFGIDVVPCLFPSSSINHGIHMLTRCTSLSLLLYLFTYVLNSPVQHYHLYSSISSNPTRTTLQIKAITLNQALPGGPQS